MICGIRHFITTDDLQETPGIDESDVETVLEQWSRRNKWVRTDRLTLSGPLFVAMCWSTDERTALGQLLNLHGLVDFLEGRFCDSGGTFAAGVNDLIDLG